MSEATKLWMHAQAAAAQLQGVEGASVSLGVYVPCEVIRDLAKLADVKVVTTLYAGTDTGPWVCERFETHLGGVEVRAQSKRAPTAADLNSASLHWSTPSSRPTTRAEVEAELAKVLR